MKKRTAIAALVFTITFLTVCIEFNVIHSHGATAANHHANVSMARWVTLLYATLFAAINAAVIFGISFALPSPDR